MKLNALSRGRYWKKPRILKRCGMWRAYYWDIDFTGWFEMPVGFDDVIGQFVLNLNKARKEVSTT